MFEFKNFSLGKGSLDFWERAGVSNQLTDVNSRRRRALSCLLVAVLGLLAATPFAQGAENGCHFLFAPAPQNFSVEPATRSLKDAISQLPTDDAKSSFHDSRGLWNDVRNLARGHHLNLSAISEDTFRASFHEIVVILSGAELGYGNLSSNLVMYKGDIFLEGNFRQNRRFIQDKSTLPSMQDFIENQGWIRWDSQSGTYHLEPQGASKRLLTHLLETHHSALSLYRGLSRADEADVISKAQKLRSADPVGNRQLVDDLLRARFGGGAAESFFTSLHKNLAVKYSSGKNPILHMTIPSEVLSKLLEKDLLYIGIEYNFVELLFYSSDGVSEILGNIQSEMPAPNLPNQ